MSLTLIGHNKEDEEKRVNKEMAKIRKKFKEVKDLQGYDRKKYVAKIIYMFMLGYEVDFGYMEALNLLSAQKFQEKLIVGLLQRTSFLIITRATSHSPSFSTRTTRCFL